ncbi:MAG: hypothetical protein ACLF0G_03785 [Candidatus Brocadiia bacterium]
MKHLVAAMALAAGLAALGGEMPVVYQEDFEKGEPLAKWQPVDPKAWTVAEQDGNHVLAMHKNSKYRPPVRSPRNYGLIRDVVVGDFVLDLRMQSRTKDYGHRDLCLFFGHQDPSHFYYVHMALRADAHAHSVFIVDGKPRKTLIPEIGKDIGGEVYRTKGIDWGDGWHRVRLVREVRSGLIEVYFDDMDQPIMRARDKTFAWGRVGVGSFDDVGNYDDIVLRGIAVEPEKK